MEKRYKIRWVVKGEIEVRNAVFLAENPRQAENAWWRDLLYNDLREYDMGDVEMMEIREID